MRYVSKIQSEELRLNAAHRKACDLARKINKQLAIQYIANISHFIHKRQFEGESPATAWKHVSPWKLHLVIAYIYSLSRNIQIDSSTSQYNLIHSLINVTSDLENSKDWFVTGNTHGINKYFRAMAQQQFIYQEHINEFDYIRQFEIFIESDLEKKISPLLEKEIGLSPKIFLYISFCLYSLIRKSVDSKIYNLNSFAELENFFGKENLINYFKILSADNNSLIKRSKSYIFNTPSSDLIWKYSENWKYPFCQTDEGWHLLCPYLFEESFRYRLYYIFREYDINLFNKYFTKSFEKYCEKLLNFAIKKTNGTYFLLNENKLKNIVKGKQEVKITDFLIYNSSCSIFIDCKSSDIREELLVANYNLLANHLESSVLKAIEQAYSLKKFIKSNRQLLNIDIEQHTYLFIITYRNYYLGKISDLWNEILSNKMSKMGYDVSEIEREVPMSRIHCISISSFEKLVSLLNDKFNLDKFLKDVEEKNSYHETSKFDLQQNILEEQPDLHNLASQFNSFDTMCYELASNLT